MPETTDYLILGLVVTFALIAFFVASVVVRYRSLQQDIFVIQQLQDED